ncbi:MAG: PilZ domain-containing protein, partial [Candidatus Acidiferrales bacterium]
LDDWLSSAIGVASEQGFGLDDLLVLLQTCRRVAIEEIGWQEDLLADLDVTINESLAYMRTQVSWEIPEGLDYLTGKNAAEPATELVSEEERGERRGHNRSQLSLPIRVRASTRGWKVEEFNKTANVARGGVYFTSRHTYQEDMQILVTYPYSDAPDALNRDYPAAVARLDKLENGRTGVALRFRVGLGSKKNSASV